MTDVVRTDLLSGVEEGEETARWDANAPTRDLELSRNDDPSYRALKNLLFGELAELKVPREARILDAGAGLGYLADDLESAGFDVVAIDPSHESIDRARVRQSVRGADVNRLEFLECTLQEYADVAPAGSFDVILANMTLNSVQELQTFMYSVAGLLKPTGYFVATIPNPRTYLQSREDIDLSNVDLRVEQTLQISFRIRNHEPHPAKVVFHHRPIRLYSVAADNAAIPLQESRVPEQIGLGRPRDIALLEFRPSRRA
jgi:2-polyprenyl-3-methyl-5-hydroxy-6-metoxy-1,4-benzoquinol methylase